MADKKGASKVSAPAKAENEDRKDENPLASLPIRSYLD
jgi:hypothetical protein